MLAPVVPRILVAAVIAIGGACMPSDDLCAQFPLLRTFPIEAGYRAPGYGSMRLLPADFDEDGDTDIMVYGAYGHTGIYLNNGRGQFSVHVTSIQQLPGAVGLVADFDGDSHADVFLAQGMTSPLPILLYHGDGAGQFTDVSSTMLPPETHVVADIAMGDIDGDGDLDLVGLVLTSSYAVAEIRSWMNGGASGFATSQLVFTGPNVTGPGWTGDRMVHLFDADGDVDLEILYGSMAGLILFMNNGQGMFTQDASGRAPAIPQALFWKAADGDLDGDGDKDLIVAAAYGAAMLENTGNGFFSIVQSPRWPFTLVSQYPGTGTSGYFTGVVILDADLDGSLDVAFSNVGSGASFGERNQFCLNDGHGNFTNATASHFEQFLAYSTWITSADVDGDGDRDLLVANTSNAYWPSGASQVFFNTHHQLQHAGGAQTGGLLRTDLYGNCGDVALLCLALSRARSQYPPFGTVWLPSNAMALVSIAPIGNNRITPVLLPLPQDPAFVGTTLVMQALTGPGNNLSRALTTNFWEGVIGP